MSVFQKIFSPLRYLSYFLKIFWRVYRSIRACISVCNGSWPSLEGLLFVAATVKAELFWDRQCHESLLKHLNGKQCVTLMFSSAQLLER